MASWETGSTRSSSRWLIITLASTCCLLLLVFTYYQSAASSLQTWRDLPFFSTSATGTAVESSSIETAADGACAAVPHGDSSADIIKDYGLANVRRSRRHEGSGYRIERFLNKAQKPGETVRVAVLGGSVSAGHGAIPGVGKGKYGAIAPEERWHQFVFEWVRQTAKAKVEFIDGSKPAVDSAYFSWCWVELIGLDVDLVMIETAINDELSEGLEEASETLLRSIMSLPSEPAVIYVDSFSIRTPTGRDGLADGGDVHAPLAAYYDVPQISLRLPLLTNMLVNSGLQEPYFRGDGRHITAPLHRALGRLVVSYLQDEHCSRYEAEASFLRDAGKEPADRLWPSMMVLGQLPKHRLQPSQRPELDDRSPPPVCRQAGSDLEPTEPSADWELVSWRQAKFYFESKKVGRNVSFEVELRDGALGQVAVSYLRSREYDLGRARCSVGNQSKKLDGHWARKPSLAQTMVIAERLAPGKYEVNCVVLKPQAEDQGRHAFRLMGIMGV